ncbi:zinc ribbon domain-containing protein [Caldichromatium japonicum]|uniref:Zinc ribbon domain-containing protein n=1 Tax=Caldichromatium japonicum TaxID=2699430 RepID=A0A6G7VC63_9GAMM|nr:zinc ribbon domain-containing protein [Caldichromatium japonicum]QIK37466.1 zinc ribbon domain-containing protein [Caldichromatium japonicum]
MPIYEYRCDNCGHELEHLQKVTDPVLVDCPACEQPTLKKQVSAAGFRLKGGGWYETDFKKSGDKKRNLLEGSDKPAEAGKEGKGVKDKPLKDAA